MKLILFDIDGTLVDGCGHKEAFREGFREVFGVEAEQDTAKTMGMTDWQIILDTMEGKGLDKQEILEKLPACMDSMAEFYQHNIDKIGVRIFEGVKHLLEELANNGFLLGLVTGNVERIARTKLGKADIIDYFKTGGFGSDAPERSDLVRLAIRRAEPSGFGPGGEVFLVGDTRLDILAGRKAKVRTIGVCWGHGSREELEEAGADFVIGGLNEKERFLEIVG
jgi:phosphoglycolate phosphatase-like HAD superfamily hydrolase